MKSRSSKIYFMYFYGCFVWLQEFCYEFSLHATFPIVKSFCMMPILFSRRLYHIKKFIYTKVTGDWFYEGSDVSADFTRNLYASISNFGESSSELLMDFYRSLFCYDLVLERLRMFLRAFP